MRTTTIRAMDIDPTNIQNWITLLGSVAAGLALIWRKALASAWAGVRTFVARFIAMVMTFSELSRDVANVKAEVTYNGGSSLKDMLRRTSQTLEYLLAEAHITTFTSNSDGMVTHLSDRATDALRCKTEELLGVGWKSYIAERDLDRIKRAWESIVRDQRSAMIDRVVFVADADEIVVDIEVRALKDKTGKFNGHVGFIKRSVD